MEITWKILQEVVDKIKENGVMYFNVIINCKDTYFLLLKMTLRKLESFSFNTNSSSQYWESNKNTMSIKLFSSKNILTLI